MSILSRMLPRSLAVLAIPMLMTACAVDVGKLAERLQRPTVAFADPTQWRCDEQKIRVPNGSVIDECSRCRNVARTPQTVTINKDETFAIPGHGIMICSTRAWIDGQSPPP